VKGNVVENRFPKLARANEEMRRKKNAPHGGCGALVDYRGLRYFAALALKRAAPSPVRESVMLPVVVKRPVVES
jgi:hypothetical protein